MTLCYQPILSGYQIAIVGGNGNRRTRTRKLTFSSHDEFVVCFWRLLIIVSRDDTTSPFSRARYDFRKTFSYVDLLPQGRHELLSVFVRRPVRQKRRVARDSGELF
jgi:hypothetical protein